MSLEVDGKIKRLTEKLFTSLSNTEEKNSVQEVSNGLKSILQSMKSSLAKIFSHVSPATLDRLLRIDQSKSG